MKFGCLPLLLVCFSHFLFVLIPPLYFVICRTTILIKRFSDFPLIITVRLIKPSLNILKRIASLFFCCKFIKFDLIQNLVKSFSGLAQNRTWYDLQTKVFKYSTISVKPNCRSVIDCVLLANVHNSSMLNTFRIKCYRY